ncbi:ferritin family protein [Candidatus Altiarchaeota archaeon]
MDENALDVLETAMQLEKDGLRFYHQVSENIEDKQVADVFQKLGRDEADHLEFLEMQYESLAKSESWMVFQELYREDETADDRPAHLLDNEKIHHLIHEGMTSAQAVKVGIKLEKDSVRFYELQSKSCGDPSGQQMYLKLMDFEKGHVKDLETLLKKLK